MIAAIVFGIFFAIVGLWAAAMIGDDYDRTPWWVRFAVALSFGGGIMSLLFGFLFLVINYVS